VSSGGDFVASSAVVEKVTEHDVGELSLEAALCLLRSLVFAELALIVDTARTTVSSLDQGGSVERGVELSISGPVQPVPADVAAGCFNGAVPV
jgi:hypothetical protein